MTITTTTGHLARSPPTNDQPRTAPTTTAETCAAVVQHRYGTVDTVALERAPASPRSARTRC